MAWKKILIWTSGLVAGVLLLSVVIGYFLLHSSAFQRFLGTKVEKYAEEAIGSRVEIQGFHLDLSTGSVEMNGVTIEGKDSARHGALLQVDRIALDIKIVSILRRQWNLNSITVDHPVARIFVDKAGNSNIPTPPTSSGEQTNIFDLAVEHAAIKGGEIYYNDRKTELNANVDDLHFQSTYSVSDGGRYFGTLGYRDGNLQYGNFRPVSHNLETKFDATRSGVKVSSLDLSIGSSRLELNGSLQNYDDPIVHTTYRATVDGAQLRQTLENTNVPSGTAVFAGTAEYRNQPNVSLANAIRVDGQLSSAALEETTPEFRGVIHDISARYSVANGNAVVQDLRAKLLGGTVNASLNIQDLTGKMQSQLEATVRDISAGDLQLLTAKNSVQDLRLSGTSDVAVRARWNGTLQDLMADVDLSLRAHAIPQPAPPASTTSAEIPVEASIKGSYSDPKKQLSLQQSYIRLPQTSMTFNGTVSEHSSLQIAVQSNDLHELETIASAFRTSKGEPARPIDLYGTASFSGSLQGSTKSPRLEGQLKAANLRIRDTSWTSLRAAIQASPSGFSVQNADLQPAQQGNITFALQSALQRWEFTPSSQFDVRLNASNLSAKNLARAANSPIQATGTLNANIAMHGTQLAPFGQGTVVLAKGSVAGEPLQAITLSFQGTGSEVHGSFGGRLPAGSVTSRFVYYPQQQNYDLLLKVAALQLAKLHTLQQSNLNLSGSLNVNGTGRGSIHNPSLTLTAEIPALKVQDQTIRGLKLQGDVREHLATVDLTSQAVNTGVRAHGTVGLTGDYPANLQVDTGTIPLEPLLASYAPQAEGVTGEAELHASLRGPLKRREAMEIHVRLPVLSLNYQNIQVGAARPVLADYAQGMLAIQRSEIRGTDTDLQFQGNIPIRSTQPLSLLLLGTVDLQILRVFAPDIRSGGQLQFDINSFGETANPNLHGRVHIVNASLAIPGSPLGLQNANGVLTVSNRRIDVTSFEGQVGGGSVTARGGVVFRPNLLFDLAATGSGITMLYPRGVRSGIDGDLTFTGNTQSALLRGQVHLDRLSFTPDFDLSSFTAQLSNQVSTPPTVGFANDVHLQINLQTGAGLNLVSRTLSLQGGANLRVQGTLAEPVVLGRAEITGGDVIFLANRYVIQGGSIAFVNPTRTEPIVNIAATTTIDQYNINLRLEGPADRLRTTYSSDPSLPPVDIINLLAFGKTTEAQAANANATGSLGAESVLASGISSQIAGRIQRIAGISQLSIDPVLGPNQGTQGARISIQQRFSSSLFVTFSSDVTSTQYQTIQVQYQLNPRWSLNTDRDQNGGFGFDARYHKSF